MSTSSNVLTVSAADVTAEIVVLDGCLNRVARGVGRLQQDLAPGLYKIRVRVGPTVEEQLVSLDQPRTVEIAAAEFPSPIPYLGTSRTHEYHRDAAIEASRTPRDAFGSGGSVLIFAREWSGSHASSPPTGNPAEGLSFAGEDGKLLRAIPGRADLRTSGDPSAGWCADVDPGPYRVRLELSDGTIFERALFVSPSQQTQLFLLRTDYQLRDGKSERRADLAGGAVSISRQHTFKPDSARGRLAELARHALTQSRRVLSEALLQQILDEKAGDPMLGLLGAHLLLRDRPEDKASFNTVTDNLMRLLGPEHPDLRMLRLRRSVPLGEDTRLLSPPMLRASWDIAIAESEHSPEMIPAQTPISDIAANILPNAPWLMWRGRDSPGSATARPERPSAIEAVLKDYIDARARAAAQSTSTRASLPFLESPSAGLESLADAEPSSLRQSQPQSEPATAAESLSTEEKVELSRTLGLPWNMLEQQLKRLPR